MDEEKLFNFSVLRSTEAARDRDPQSNAAILVDHYYSDVSDLLLPVVTRVATALAEADDDVTLEQLAKQADLGPLEPPDTQRIRNLANNRFLDELKLLARDSSSRRGVVEASEMLTAAALLAALPDTAPETKVGTWLQAHPIVVNPRFLWSRGFR